MTVRGSTGQGGQHQHQDDEEVRCERCHRTTFSWAAEACAWWPEGCQGDDKRVCAGCRTPAEVRELAELGCTAAAFRAMDLD